MFKWHGEFGKDRLQFKVKFITKVKDMLNTIRLLLCRVMSGDLDISRFTANIIIIIKKK